MAFSESGHVTCITTMCNQFLLSGYALHIQHCKEKCHRNFCHNIFYEIRNMNLYLKLTDLKQERFCKLLHSQSSVVVPWYWAIGAVITLWIPLRPRKIKTQEWFCKDTSDFHSTYFTNHKYHSKTNSQMYKNIIQSMKLYKVYPRTKLWTSEAYNKEHYQPKQMRKYVVYLAIYS
jgi:hypothetical protein